ncbi:MAG: HlyD family efflux transporter periplasmic adaptor subunit [Ardenticatenaceae bacterium]|nr:HlyD family efflux transporter periplasmic adaptor subunit [Anaerolineales bacterium]MCB8973786.1 HlyD family efflux transporter periplasmic adaptor subunit [Ardenticatenaceae bacterium]
MNKKTLTIIFILAVVVAAAGISWWQFQPVAAANEEPLEATGVIEARTVNLSPEVGGQVREVLVEEGERVITGQLLVHLDDSLVLSQRSQAQATWQAAQAQLALLQAGATAEQIAAAEAQLAQAEANLHLAQANLALAEAGATAEQIAAAEAHLAQTEAGLHTIQVNLDTLTAGTPPQTIAATETSLALAWNRYNYMRASLTTEQLEALRTALTTAENNLAAAEAHQDHVSEDTRNPVQIVNVFAESVVDAETAVTTAQQAYDAAQDETRPYTHQIEQVRQSWELAQANLVIAQARYDGLAADSRTTADALDAAQEIVDNAEELATAAQTAYDSLTSGISATQLAAAWREVQRLQAQLNAYALAAPGSTASTPSVESLLAQIEAAAAQNEIAAANLAGVLNGARIEEIAAAQAQVDAAMAQRDMAAASLAGLVNGARAEEIAAAQAQVNAAQAQLAMLDVQLGKFTITAPWDGILLTRSVEPGETALPGTTLLEIGRLDRLKLTVYLPEDRFGIVTPGQSATVTVDTYPDREFIGTVLQVADEAEFTPSNIQTQEERVRLVYAVVISLENPDLALKPGMIADAEFEQ